MRGEWPLILYDWCPCKKAAMGRHRDTGKQPCEDGGGNCNDASKSQGTPRVAENHWKPEEARKDLPLEPSEKHASDSTLIQNYLAFRTIYQIIDFYCLKPPRN